MTLATSDKYTLAALPSSIEGVEGVRFQMGSRWLWVERGEALKLAAGILANLPVTLSE